MDIKVFQPWYDQSHQTVLRAFARGCGASIHDVRNYEPCDIAVIFGLVKRSYKNTQYKANIIRQHKGDVIVVERGFIHREVYWSAGYNGINGHADFNNENSPSDRWEQLGVDLKPWKREGGKYALVCGQVPWDVTVQDTPHRSWCRDMVTKCKRLGHTTVFRPHPLTLKRGEGYGITLDHVSSVSTRPIHHDFDDAKFCVTWNSNSAVEAVVAGVPTVVAGQGSMAAPVKSYDLDTDTASFPDRQQWANDLAYSQWTIEEFCSGATWNSLRR